MALSPEALELEAKRSVFRCAELDANRHGITPASLEARSGASRTAVRYAGVLASASRLRSRIVPPRASENTDDDTEGAAPARGGSRCRWRPWAELMKRVFEVDLQKCALCGSPMKLRAVITEPANVSRYLRHLDVATELPPRAPARDPPYFQSHVVRRKLGEQLVLVA